MIQSEQVPEKVPESSGVVTKTLKKNCCGRGTKDNPTKKQPFLKPVLSVIL